uniref:Protein-tyrosine sulfotransferase n=1 Tax=Alexandrium catenella TaxID=2925 RepID=A0A7S1RWM2_ALECA
MSPHQSRLLLWFRIPCELQLVMGRLAAAFLGASLLQHAPALRLGQPQVDQFEEFNGHLQREMARNTEVVPPSKEIKVIGAGATRTGTQSMLVAMEILGFRTAHQESTFNLTRRQKWLEWERGGPFEPALQTLLDDGVVATTGDDPWGAAYKELLQRFPNAKVVMTKHPRGAEGWLKSVEKAVSRPLVEYTRGHKNGFSDYWDFVFEGCVRIRQCPVNETMTDDMRKKCMENYEENMNEVRRSVPPNQLLEFSVTDGWDPLVKFLGVPKPSVPFPKVDMMNSLGGGEFSAVSDEFDAKILKFPRNGYY